MTTSYANLLTACLIAMGDSDATTWSRTDVIMPWTKEAMLAFPILRPMITTITVAGAATHANDLPADFRDVITIEYPLSQEPPKYLVRKNRLDPNFYSLDVFYDIDRNFTDGSGWVLWTSKLLAIGEQLIINYLANHKTDLVDGLNLITVPDEYVPIIVQYVVCKGYRERLGAYMQDPSAHTTIVSQMYEMVQHAEERYQAMLDEAVKRYTDSRISPHMQVDKFDRVY